MENEKKKNGNKKWIIIAVVAVLLIIVIGASSNSETTPTVEQIESTSEQVTDSTQKEETKADVADQSNIKSGTSVSTDDVKISFKSCNTDFKNYSEYAELKSGYKVIEAVFDFENISDTDITLNGFECYADGLKCEEFYYVEDYSSPTLQSLSSGRKLADCSVYFEVPEEATEIELEYQADFWNEDKFIFVVE